MLREQWRRGRDEAGEKRRGEGLTCDGSLAELLEATGNGAGGAAGGLRWPTVALSLSVFRSLLCFFFFFFFFFWYSPSILLSLLSSPSISLLFLPLFL
jgi:hypothetical protein